MSEIGSGSGSSYSGTIDTNASVEVNAPNPGKTKARKEVVEDLSSCVINIETTLGVNPQGSKSTVVARLDTEHNSDGSHNDAYIVTVSGQNQTITGRKVFASGISLGVDGLYGTATGYVTGKTTVGASGAMWLKDDVQTSASMTAGGQMNAESFTQSATRISSGLNAEFHNGLSVKMFDIGAWNMNATAQITFAHGLGSGSTFYDMQAFISSDLGAPFVKFPIDYFNGTTVSGAISKTATLIVLERTTGGAFDGTEYDSTAINRGVVIVWYIP